MTRTFGRFLLSGGFNTGVTYILYLLLLSIFPYKVSYTIAFVSGIVLAYVLNSLFVFQTKGNATMVLLFPLIYLLQYLIGLAIVSLWVEVLYWTPLIAPIAAIIVTIPLTFLLTQWLFLGISSTDSIIQRRKIYHD